MKIDFANGILMWFYQSMGQCHLTKGTPLNKLTR